MYDSLAQVILDPSLTAANVLQVKGKKQPFVCRVGAIAVAAKYSYAGLRAQSQYGMVLQAIDVVNLEATDQLFGIYIGIGQAPNGALLSGVRRRDTGLLSDGSVNPASVYAWIGQSSTLDGTRIRQVAVKASDTKSVRLNLFVPRDQDIYLVNETQNKQVAGVWDGTEFESQEMQDFYLAQLL